jgi:hypothetical protein
MHVLIDFATLKPRDARIEATSMASVGCGNDIVCGTTRKPRGTGPLILRRPESAWIVTAPRVRRGPRRRAISGAQACCP